MDLEVSGEPSEALFFTEVRGILVTCILEASGVDPSNLKAYAATGIDLISTSAPITRSSWFDLSMRFD